MSGGNGGSALVTGSFYPIQTRQRRLDALNGIQIAGLKSRQQRFGLGLEVPEIRLGGKLLRHSYPLSVSARCPLLYWQKEGLMVSCGLQKVA